MEVIGLAAAIVAIGQAAEIALKMSRSMRRLARRLRAAQDDIRQFAKDIEAFSSVIGAAHFSLHSHCTPEKSLSPVLRYIDHSKVLDQLVEQSEGLIDHIGEVKPRIQSLESRIKVKTKVMWLFRRTEVEALGPKMESVKASLNLIITIVTLETVSQKDSSKEVRREIKRLGREVRHLMSQIVELQKKCFTQQGWRVQADNSFLELQEDIQNVLVDLGESIVQNGTVPDAGHPSVSSSTLRDNNNVYNASPRGERHQHSQPRRELRHAGSPIRLQHTILRSRESSRQPHDSGPSPERNTTRAVTSREESANEEPSQAQPVMSLLAPNAHIQEATVPDSTIPHSGPVLPQEGDFMSVAPISYVLHLNQDSVMEAVSGYITTPNGRVSITALLDQSLEQNIISAAFATRNRLVIQEQDEEEEDIWIDFGDGKQQKSLGTVALEWSESMYERSVKIHCLVYEHNIRDLVFGRPFVEKTRHYRLEGGSMV